MGKDDVYKWWSARLRHPSLLAVPAPERRISRLSLHYPHSSHIVRYHPFEPIRHLFPLSHMAFPFKNRCQKHRPGELRRQEAHGAAHRHALGRGDHLREAEVGQLGLRKVMTYLYS